MVARKNVLGGGFSDESRRRRKKQDRKVTAFGNQSGWFLLTCLFRVEPFRKKNLFLK